VPVIQHTVLVWVLDQLAICDYSSACGIGAPSMLNAPVLFKVGNDHRTLFPVQTSAKRWELKRGFVVANASAKRATMAECLTTSPACEHSNDGSNLMVSAMS
jgi:hypothetical protein